MWDSRELDIDFSDEEDTRYNSNLNYLLQIDQIRPSLTLQLVESFLPRGILSEWPLGNKK
jgi:hypothetical protein